MRLEDGHTLAHAVGSLSDYSGKSPSAQRECAHRNLWVSYCSELDEDGIACQATIDVERIADERDEARKVLRDLVSAYMAGDDLAPIVKRAEDLTGGQQNGS